MELGDTVIGFRELCAVISRIQSATMLLSCTTSGAIEQLAEFGHMSS